LQTLLLVMACRKCRTQRQVRKQRRQASLQRQTVKAGLQVTPVQRTHLQLLAMWLPQC
jgi:hypothetical protein